MPEKKSPEIPHPEGHWLLGSWREIARSPHLFPAELGWKYGGLAQFRILNKRFIAIARPDYAHHILVARAENYVRSYHHRSIEAITGKGLLATEGDHWRMRRRQVQPGFHQDMLKHLVDPIQKSCLTMVAEWEKYCKSGEYFDIVASMQKLTLQVIARSLLSIEIEEREALAFARAVRDSLKLIRQHNTSFLRLPFWFPTPNHRQIQRKQQTLDNFLSAHIHQRQQEGNSGHSDILAVLLQTRDSETGETMSSEALLSEVKTLFVAGFETTATALSWIVYLLASHSEVAAQLYEEVDRVLGVRLPTWEDLSDLPFTQQIIQEALRLYPPVYNLGRQSLQEDEMGGYMIPKGITLLISIYGIHRSREYWEEPEAFRPERFAASAQMTVHRQAYLPFALGQHTCIGNYFATIEMVITLVAIAQRYRLQLPKDFQVEASAQITLVPRTEVPIKLVSRV